MSTRRLFFGIGLPQTIQQEIIAWRAAAFDAAAGRPLAAANLHLTLAFLGEVSDEKTTAISRLAGRIRQPPFTLHIDDAGHWPRPGVVWLGLRQAPRGLVQLAEMLRSQAARSGCYQSPHPFHPHISLLRNATRPVAMPPRDFHWQFDVTHFSLLQSTFAQGRSSYKVIESWPLIARQE
ncbi:2'-5' RNA ligase [Erwinia toletana]|uniref:RNA 2',3'-cyclic phosphodiesterase n=1 Tax=Winslowiella toletana TaxID=92490 RepID=A0ABS4PCQ5_9GAMM|nr:RNA 2',3'-cyclic phosphodiesterase [Winslowiella toletana]MBP2169856.1 2'-5' RNA ligase [Winslowiella toletana]